MLGFKFLVAALLLSCTPPSPSKPQVEPAPEADITSASAAEFYGLQVGGRWTFLRTDDVLRWKEITGCEDVVVRDPQTGEVSLVRAYVRENRSEYGTTSVHYLIEDEEGVKRIRRDDVDEGELDMYATYNPPGPRLYNGPYPDGYQWSFSQINGEFDPAGDLSRGSSETSAVDEVLGVEVIQVMAGSFLTLSVEREWAANTAHNVISHYAPGVGEIRERTEWPTTPLPTVQIEELVSYTPGYGSCDGRQPLFERSCDAPLLSCEQPWGTGPAGCTDPRVDAYNCGGCGTVCESGVCAGGSCVEPSCALDCLGTTVCCQNGWDRGLESCTSPARDKANCGACGNECPAGTICDHGACTCGPGTADCYGLGCVDVLDDPTNCGACGVTCGGDTPVCDKGVCVQTCLSVDLVTCGDTCVDLDWDSNNCGACGTKCGDGTGTTSCVEGTCVTCDQAGLTECGGNCVDTDWSDANCGRCGQPCVDGEVCVAGACRGGNCTGVDPCVDGDEICCDGLCIDPRTSDNHCGGCNVDQCAGGCTEACRNGLCTPVDCGGGED